MDVWGGVATGWKCWKRASFFILILLCVCLCGGRYVGSVVTIETAPVLRVKVHFDRFSPK